MIPAVYPFPFVVQMTGMWCSRAAQAGENVGLATVVISSMGESRAGFLPLTAALLSSVAVVSVTCCRNSDPRALMSLRYVCARVVSGICTSRWTVAFYLGRLGSSGG